MKKKVIKHSSLDIKINKAAQALEVLNLELTPEEKKTIADLFELCRIGPDLAKELKTHPGVYAYLALNKQAVQEQFELDTLELQHKKQHFDDLTEYVTATIRAALESDEDNKKKFKLTGESKKEIVALLRLGKLTSVKDSEYYDALTDEDLTKEIKKMEHETHNLDMEISLLENSVLGKKMQIAFLEQVTNAFAYQRSMALRSLVELTVRELNQELGHN